MERRNALVSAALVSGAVFAAGAAIGLNTDLLSSEAEPNPVGQLEVADVIESDPTTTTSAPAPPQTVVIDEYVTDPATGSGAVDSGGSAPGVARDTSATAGAPATVVAPEAPSAEPAPVLSLDDGDDDDGYALEDPEHESENHEEFEGHDDDD